MYTHQINNFWLRSPPTLISNSSSTMAAMMVKSAWLGPRGRSSQDWKGMLMWLSCINAITPKWDVLNVRIFFSGMVTHPQTGNFGQHNFRFVFLFQVFAWNQVNLHPHYSIFFSFLQLQQFHVFSFVVAHSPIMYPAFGHQGQLIDDFDFDEKLHIHNKQINLHCLIREWIYSMV